MKGTEKELHIPALNEIVCDDESILVRNAAYDAYRVCLRFFIHQFCSQRIRF